MIRITDTDKIKTKGDFALDGLLIKKLYFDKGATGSGIESLVIEGIPFVRMDDGTILSNDLKSATYKVMIPDLTSKMYDGSLSAECVQALVTAYFANEQAVQLLMSEIGGVGCAWEAPQ